ncbi:MAG: cytochrome b/b6 domain-containing protein [Burkholderiales bacterium]
MREVKVWDIVVRVGHWSLVALFTVAYLSGEGDAETLHAWAGYAVLGIVAFRILWGFVGTKYARFSEFVAGWRATADYARSLLAFRPKHYLGHNPLGGWMIVALLSTLLLLSWSGLEAYAAKGKGPLAQTTLTPIAEARAHDDEDGKGNHESLWEDVHEALANFCLFLVLLHVSGALGASLIHRENLVRAMVTGKKRLPK